MSLRPNEVRLSGGLSPPSTQHLHYCGRTRQPVGAEDARRGRRGLGRNGLIHRRDDDLPGARVAHQVREAEPRHLVVTRVETHKGPYA